MTYQVDRSGVVHPFHVRGELAGLRRSLAVSSAEEEERARHIAEIEAMLHLLESHELRDLKARTVERIGCRR